MYLMYKDSKLLYFDFNEFIVEVINNDLLPFALRNGFKLNNTPQNIAYNVQLLKSYLSSRVLSLSRENAKLIYALFNIPQLNDINTRNDICIKCRGVSIQDSYWIKEKESEQWGSYNIRVNSLHSIVDIALNGVYPSITTSSLCPELTTHGLFQKAWTREKDALYLLKSDKTNDYVNTKMEVLASQVLDCTNINHIQYTGRYRNTKTGRHYVDKCKNFITEDADFVEAWEVIEYCKRMNIDYESFCMNIDNSFANIPVIDYIIINTDRHTQNYGFLMNSSGVLIKVAPLFDFNCALVADYFDRYAEDTYSQMLNNTISIKDLMLKYLPYSNIIIDINKFSELHNRTKQYQNILCKVSNRLRKINLV